MALPTSGTIDPADWEAEFDAIVTDLTDVAFRQTVVDDFAYTNGERKLIIEAVGFDVTSAADVELWFTAPDTLIVSAVWVVGCDSGSTTGTLTATLTGDLTPDLVRQGDGYSLSGTSLAGRNEGGAGEEVYQDVGTVTGPKSDAVMLRKGQLYKINVSSDNAGAIERVSCYIQCHVPRRID